MTGYVYMLTSPGGKRYVGRTVNLKRRMSHYIAKSNADVSPVYREIAKFGFDAFKKEILDTVEADTEVELNIKLNASEKGFIELFDTVNSGLNVNRCDSAIRVYSLSEETRERMRKSQTGRKHSEESRMKRSGENAYQGKEVTSDKLGMTFPTLREAAHYVGVSNGCKVSEVINGKKKTCGINPKTGERIDDWRFV